MQYAHNLLPFFLIPAVSCLYILRRCRYERTGI
nr:MAG TPA: DVL family [Bacteriophage sp.]